MQQQAPTKWTVFEPGISIMVVTGLLKGAPHPNAGKLLIEFVTSEEGQAILSKNLYVPALPKVAPIAPVVTPTSAGYKARYYSGMDTDKALEKWNAIVKDLFK
jgi:iron(III) transport system substrate-binding protein